MKKNNNIQDNQIRELLSETKISANENLKFRIMQQIETERSLAKGNLEKSSLRVKSLLSVFGGIYGVIILLIALVYFTYGIETLTSMPVLVTIVSIASIGSVLWMILVFDEKRRTNYHNKPK